MTRVPVIDEVIAVVMGFAPTPASYVKIRNIESWNNRRRIQVVDLRRW